MTWTALGLAKELHAGGRTATEIVSDLLDLLDRLTPVIGAVAATDPERTLADAREADRRLRAGEGRILQGVPFTVKDWIDAEGWLVSGATATDPGSPQRRPAADATAVARLRAAGGIVLGITRAMASSAAHGPTRNPHDPSRAPGGSSSGAAALLAAGASPLALGSDSGGSLRLPAAWCGVVGLKPTFGRVPLTGHFPRCGSLEDGRTVIGPLARTVDDLGAVLALLAGPDGLDAGAVPVPLGDPGAVDLSALRVSVVAPPWRESVDTDYQWMLPWSLTGAPVVAVPVGVCNGLPVAVQVVGRPWQDHVALAAVRCIEATVPAIPEANPLAERE